MEAACAKVSSVSEFLEDASLRVSRLEAGLERTDSSLRERSRETDETLQGVHSQLQEKADLCVPLLPSPGPSPSPSANTDAIQENGKPG
ncbi:unnamed protein product [Discosporangium mesarthrocarpum]